MNWQRCLVLGGMVLCLSIGGGLYVYQREPSQFLDSSLPDGEKESEESKATEGIVISAAEFDDLFVRKRITRSKQPQTPPTLSSTEWPVSGQMDAISLSKEQTSMVVAQNEAAQSTPSAPTEPLMELVGFVVRGQRMYHRLQIDDLDSLVTTDGRRWLPLLRVLRAFRIPIEEADTLKFTPEGRPPMSLDLAAGEITMGGDVRKIEMIQAVSEMTLESDVYLLPQDLGDILGMDLEWDTALYEFRIKVDRELNIWRRKAGSSLLAMQTKYLAADIPEVLGSADRSKNPLHFFEMHWRPTFSTRTNPNSDAGPSSVELLTLASPTETMWGNVLNGQYKLQVSHPDLLWGNNDHQWQWRNDDAFVARAEWFEWLYRFKSTEVTLGDSTLGLGELVYPAFRATGVRINGLTGYSAQELDTDRSSMGTRQYFGRSHIFEGTAPINAQVQLVLNGRVIDEQAVFPEQDSPPGIGVYRFDDVELPSNILNQIEIVITESNGNVIRVEQNVMGSPLLLPQGKSAYLGVVGKRRERTRGKHKPIEFGDFYGQIAAARLLHGVTDRLTVGGILSGQEDHYERMNEGVVLGRAYPSKTTHASALISFLPWDPLLLSGDVALSQGEGKDRYDDTAIRLRAKYLPTSRLRTYCDMLRLGPDYFDGLDLDMANVVGGDTGFYWKMQRQWSLLGAAGLVRNNVDKKSTQTLRVDYQNFGVETTVLPKSKVTLRLDRMNQTYLPTPALLTGIKIRSMLPWGWSLYGASTVGDSLQLKDDTSFLARLRLEGAPRYTEPGHYWTLRKPLNQTHTLGLLYSDTEYQRTSALVHDCGLVLNRHTLRAHTELLYDHDVDPGDPHVGILNRSEYLLDRVGANRVGVSGQYREGRYAIMFYLNFTNLWARHNKRCINVNQHRIRPAYGAIHGKVFVDYNGNARLDPNEPGVPDIGVQIDYGRTCYTDKEGYYILRGQPYHASARVHLNIDTVPAYYTVTHGTQLAYVYKGSVTEVNLAVAPLIAVVGKLVAAPVDPNRYVPNMGGGAPIAGVRVYLVKERSQRVMVNSYTADDGSYYLGDLKPGHYLLRIDTDTLPSKYEIREPNYPVDIQPTREEFLEITYPDIVVHPVSVELPIKSPLNESPVGS